MRWLLLDEILEIRANERACARGRIPETSVHVEFLMIEMMIQTGSLLLGLLSDFMEDVVITKIETAEFYSEWRPGEVVEIESVCDQMRPEAAWLWGHVRNASGLFARSRFLLMNVGRLSSARKDSITFYDRFMEYFQIRKKIIGSSL